MKTNKWSKTFCYNNFKPANLGILVENIHTLTLHESWHTCRKHTHLNFA